MKGFIGDFMLQRTKINVYIKLFKNNYADFRSNNFDPLTVINVNFRS